MESSIAEFPAVKSPEITCLSVATKHGKIGSTERFLTQIYLITPDF